jgi:hypothetical protein
MNEENLTKQNKRENVVEIETKRTEIETKTAERVEIFKNSIIKYVKNNQSSDCKKMLIKLKNLSSIFNINDIHNNNNETLLHLAIRTLYDYTDDHGFSGYNRGRYYDIENYTKSMYEIIEILINEGSNINDVSYDGFTSLEYARNIQREEIADFIIKIKK